MITMGEGIKLTINPIGEYPIDRNFSFTISDGDVIATAEGDPEYEQFLADVWVGVVLTLMVLSCVCCMCSCLLYHKFQQWKRNVIEARTTANLEAGTLEVDLPSYTIASGLPTYQEALEQLKIVKELTGREKASSKNNTTKTSSASPLSVVTLFQNYNTKSSNNDLKN